MNVLSRVLEKWKADVAKVFGKEIKYCPLLDKECRGKLCGWFIDGVGCSVFVLAIATLQSHEAHSAQPKD